MSENFKFARQQIHRYSQLITRNHFRTNSNILSREHGGLVVHHQGFDPHVHGALCSH